MVSSTSKIFCVIGNPVKHSKSPIIHNFIFNKLGLDAIYVAFEVKDLKTFFSFLRDVGISGVSITIPYKVESMNYVDWVDEMAGRIGAINTIKNEEGFLKGFNTDIEGIIKAFEVKGITTLKGKSSLVLGTGGVSRSTVYALILLGTHTIVVAGRSEEKTKTLIDEVKPYFGDIEGINFENVDSIVNEVDLIANCTPIGMVPDTDSLPVNANLIQKKHIVFDTVYTPSETKLLEIAKNVGAKVVYGVDMFVFQALSQQRIWINREDVFSLRDDIIDLLNHFR